MYVCDVKDSSSMVGMIRLEDRVLARDDEDVQGMSAVAVRPPDRRTSTT